MNDLLPCPFCGGAEQMVIDRTCDQSTPYNPADYAYPRVRCKCGVEIGGENWGEPTTAIAAWNRRSLTQELAAKDKEIAGLKLANNVLAQLAGHEENQREHNLRRAGEARAEAAEAQLTALKSLVTEAAETLEPLAGYAISSIGSDLDGWVVKLADNAQQPTFNDFDRVRRTLSRLNEAVKP